MNERIKTKVRKASKRYLQMRGFEALEDGWAHVRDSVDFIAIDGENGGQNRHPLRDRHLRPPVTWHPSIVLETCRND